VHKKSKMRGLVGKNDVEILKIIIWWLSIHLLGVHSIAFIPSSSLLTLYILFKFCVRVRGFLQGIQFGLYNCVISIGTSQDTLSVVHPHPVVHVLTLALIGALICRTPRLGTGAEGRGHGRTQYISASG
jgi:hypothetical protein